MITEADICRIYVLPKLKAAGWNEEPHSFTEQKTFTDGRIVVVGSKTKRRPQKCADYLLRYIRDFMIAMVEAKPTFRVQSRPVIMRHARLVELRNRMEKVS